MDITTINEALAAAATRNSSLVKLVSTETIQENSYESGATGERWEIFQSLKDEEVFVKLVSYTDSYGDITGQMYQIVKPVEKSIVQYENI